MNILVTGGAGYIGSILVPILLKNNHNVTVLDNFLFNQKSLENIKKNPNLEIIRADVRNEKIIKNLISKFDLVVPLAALVGAPLCEKNPKDAKEVNLNSILFLNSILSKKSKSHNARHKFWIWYW